MRTLSILSAVWLVLAPVCALLPGDRITASYKTVQGTSIPRWIDLDLTQLPRFQQYASVMIMPVFEESFDPREDAKVFFTFADGKLMIPWTDLYSAKEISNMEKLIITFVHDEFDVLQVQYQPLYGTNLDIISKAAYPLLEVEYQWESVQEDDVTTGVRALFFIGLILFGFLSFSSCRDVGGPKGKSPPPPSFHSSTAPRHDAYSRKKNVD